MPCVNSQTERLRMFSGLRKLRKDLLFISATVSLIIGLRVKLYPIRPNFTSPLNLLLNGIHKQAYANT